MVLKSIPKLALIFALMVPVTGCNRHGKKVKENGCEVHYKKPVKKSRAKKVLKFLNETKFCNGDRKSLQIRKEGEGFEFRMVVKKGKEKDAKILQVMATYAAQLSASVFDGKRVEIHLCDKRLKTLKVVEAAR
jgi:hypothetical protein